LGTEAGAFFVHRIGKIEVFCTTISASKALQIPVLVPAIRWNPKALEALFGVVQDRSPSVDKSVLTHPANHGAFVIAIMCGS
jgi:hypothetical protein